MGFVVSVLVWFNKLSIFRASVSLPYCGMVVLLFSGMLPSVAHAVELSPKGTRNGGIALNLSGEIQEGDAEKVQSNLESAKERGVDVGTITLNSPGGRVSVGASIARLIRNKQIKTAVDDGAICASACFMIFAAGKERFASNNARIGVHSAVNPVRGEDDGAKSATIDMSRFLSELGVPASVLGKLVTARPSEMAWLTPEDLRLMRVNGIQPTPSRDSYVERVSPAIEKVSQRVSIELRRKADTLLVQGTSSLRAKQISQAASFLKQAYALNPYDPDVTSTYGYSLHLAGKNEEAKDVLLLSLQLKDDFPETHKIMALTVAALNDREWAKESLMKYKKYTNHKDIAIIEIRRISVDSTESILINNVAKEILNTTLNR